MKFAAAFNQGDAPTIAMVNKATVGFGDFNALTAALQKFLDTCFVPVWHTPATLVVADSAKPGQWSIVFLDDADQAGALGYHDLTTGGQPISKVFVKTALKVGDSVSVTACHELCEMLIDPACQMWADDGRGVLHAYEMCDACEEELFQIDGIDMSDFVYPAFFEGWRKAGNVKFDYLGHVKKPFQTLSGGYQIVMKEGKVGQVFGSPHKAARFAKEDRRMHRSEYRLPNHTRVDSVCE